MFSTSVDSNRRGISGAASCFSASAFARLLGSLATATVILCCYSGCSTIHNGFQSLRNNSDWNDSVILLRNRNFASKAWHRRKHNFANQAHTSDFSAGFRAGYINAAEGGDGCTPSHPPQEYWGWQFQSAVGQSRTSAWFAGYPYGYTAAIEEGIANCNQLQLGTMSPAQDPMYAMTDLQNGALSISPLPTSPSMNGGYPLQLEPMHGLPDGFAPRPAPEIIPPLPTVD